jgi:ABC-2 type transport system ATP-binding protein
MIEVNDLTKTFGVITAVDNLSFTVAQGEVVGFLGPNGAGKTTAMRLITGFYAPDTGDVTIDGIPVLEQPTQAQQKIGYLPENNPLYKDMLVAEFLRLCARLHRIPKHERANALDFAVNAVGIDEVYYRPIGQLSKGFKQRVGIAGALIHRPPILILDEPTEGLDPNQRGDMRQLIKDLAKDHTIVLSTHVMQEAQAVCDRLLIINKGKLIADGSTEALSRETRRERVIILEAEGNGFDRDIKEMDGIDHIEVEPAQHGRSIARIAMREGFDVRPAISTLVRERRWTIWRLQEEEHRLEDIFHELTSDV